MFCFSLEVFYPLVEELIVYLYSLLSFLIKFSFSVSSSSFFLPLLFSAFFFFLSFLAFFSFFSYLVFFNSLSASSFHSSPSIGLALSDLLLSTLSIFLPCSIDLRIASSNSLGFKVPYFLPLVPLATFGERVLISKAWLFANRCS